MNKSSYTHIMTLANMYIFSNVVFIKENKKYFIKQSESHEHDTREKFDLVKPTIRLHRSYKSHKYQQFVLFNKLPSVIRNLPKDMFKKKVKELLKTRVFYTLKEYLSSEFVTT